MCHPLPRPRNNWHDWLFFQVARGEVEKELKAEPKPGPK